jgi:hypothetical protein
MRSSPLLASEIPEDIAKREELSAMYIAADTIALFAKRHAEELERHGCY